VKGIEIRELNTDELIIKEKELKQELFNLRFQKATGQLNNTAIIGKVKKDLARVKTISREMHILKKTERG
jgi:large subunit ribosomal protein L29